ncbi:MAG: hypothetical protein ABSE68_02355 [Minisyncoccia bacterium]
MTLVYLIRRFFYRILEFLRHWYVKSAKIYSNFVLERLESIDRVLAWRVNFKYLFQPLYGDYSFLGRVLSFFIRIPKLIGTSLIYLVIFAVAVFIYLVWILFPLAVVAVVFTN